MIEPGVILRLGDIGILLEIEGAEMGVDPRLHPVARQINLMHHKDESRHMAFGKLVVKLA